MHTQYAASSLPPNTFYTRDGFLQANNQFIAIASLLLHTMHSLAFSAVTVLFVSNFCLSSGSPIKQEEDPITLEDTGDVYIRQSLVRRHCPVRGDIKENVPKFACPKKNADGVTYTCVRYEDLCNGIVDCPQGDDELLEFCMFHKLYEHQQASVVHELKVVGDHLRDDIRQLAKEVDNIKESEAAIDTYEQF